MEKWEKIDEILELIDIPEVRNFFFNALEEAKVKFKTQIQQFRETNNEKRKKGKEAIDLPDLQQFSAEKSYFFDLNRIKDTENGSGFRWIVDNFKFKDDPEIIDFIFSPFFKKIDQIEIDPQNIKNEILQTETDISIEINYYKTSPAHVGGFIRTHKQKEKKSPEDSKVIKISQKHAESDNEAMYNEIIRLMKKDRAFREYVFFQYRTIQKLKS